MFNISSCWNASLLSCMIRQVTCNMWMKPKRSCCARMENNGEAFPTQDALLQHSKWVALWGGIWCTMSRVNMHLLQKVGARLLMKIVSHGFLCGACYRWTSKIESALNSAASPAGSTMSDINSILFYNSFDIYIYIGSKKIMCYYVYSLKTYV